MRIDLCLSRLCLFKTRSQARSACEEGRVLLNGQAARPSREVHPGDRICFRDRLGRVEEEVEIVATPEGNVSRAAARELYRVLARRAVANPWGSSETPGSEAPGSEGTDSETPDPEQAEYKRPDSEPPDSEPPAHRI
jgi:ribosomal 50S subunit-recycling heat shock protein